MADYNDIKQVIAANLPDNNKQEITAEKLRSTLNEFVDKVTETETGIEDNVSEINTKIVRLGKEGIYDVSANNDGETFASLSALLSSVNLSTLIPDDIRCGGMSIRFVRSSDNKYMQYRLTNQNWSIDVNDWTGGESEGIIGDFASEINKLNGNIFVRRGYYINRSGKKVSSTTDNSYAVSLIIPIDRKNNIDYDGINNNSAGAILFLDENFESIFVSPLALTQKFVLTPSQIDAYEQDTTLNPDGKTIKYFIACANLTYKPNAYCYNISINSVNTFVNTIKTNVDGLVNDINTAFKFKGVITDYTTSFQTLDSGFYRLSANTANTFADLPDKEKTGSPGARDWELVVFKVDYGVIYLLKRIQRNEGFPEYYLGYIYYGMSSIEWQVIRTDFSLKNHNEEMIFTGDSIMVRLMGEKEYLESLTNYTIINKAISGSCMALRTDGLAEEWNPKSMVYRTNPNNSGSENFIDVSNAKKIFIWMGVNDRTAGNPLGADDSTSEHEIMGAMRKIVENLLTQNPYISICFATPNANPNQSSNSPTLEDYANRIISGCEILNVECLDIFHQSCITETNKDIVFVDGLHPKQDWLHNVAANKFKERM